MQKIKKYHKGSHTYIKWDKNVKQVILDKKKKIIKNDINIEVPEDFNNDIPDDFIIYFTPEEFVIDFVIKSNSELSQNVTFSNYSVIKQFKILKRIILTPKKMKKLLLDFSKFKDNL